MVMRVKEFADVLKTTPDTVRYYSRIGYLKPAINKLNGYKEYSNTDLNRLRFVLSARHLGFSVDDIGEILAVAGKGNTPCPLVRDLIQKRLEKTEKQFLETVNLHDQMKAAVNEWKDKPDKEPTGDTICHLIEDFMKNPDVTIGS